MVGQPGCNDAVGLCRAEARPCISRPAASAARRSSSPGSSPWKAFHRRQDDMRGLPDLAVDDVDADAEDAARVDRTDDRIDQAPPGSPRRVRPLPPSPCSSGGCRRSELGGVERGLVVVVGPDVVHLAAARDDELVDVGCRAADMGVGGAEIAFLVSAETADATAFATDVAGCKDLCSPVPR